MEVLAITSSGASPTEVQRITDLFENGLMVLHLRKPKLDSKEVEDILKQIPKKYLPYIMIHGKYNLASKYNLRGVHLKRSHRNNNLSSIVDPIVLFYCSFLIVKSSMVEIGSNSIFLKKQSDFFCLFSAPNIDN